MPDTPLPESPTPDTEPTKPESPRVIPCSDPATGESLGEVPVDDPRAVEKAIAAARRAQREWSRTSFAERRRVLRHLLDQLLAQADDLCAAICRDTGKTLHHAMIGEIWPIAEKLRWTLDHGETHLRPEPVRSGVLVHKRARVEFQPLGVIGVIAPWNVPLQNILGPAIPALFAGNACIVKVSEWTAWSVAPFRAFLRRCLADCGHSPDLIQLLNGYAETGQALIRGGVDKIVFTGSARNGRAVMATAAETLTPVILELGGKDPLIVCDDADLEQAANAAACGAFIGSGQTCLAAERVLVFDRVHDDFAMRVQDIALRLRQGAPLLGKLVDIGAMTMPAQVDHVAELVEDALEKGARLLAGGKRAKRKKSKHYFEPTVLTEVTPAMRIMHEETFGPVVAIARVANEAEAVRVANDTEYGLSAAVYTKSRARGRRIAHELVAGSACINDWAVMYMVQDLPFGGVKASGFGRLNGRDGLRACTNPKSVIEDRLPLYPVPSLFPGRRYDYEVVRAGVRLFYGKGVNAKIGAARELGQALLRRAKS